MNFTAIKTRTAIHAVSTSIRPIGRQPTAKRALNEVFMPSAAIAALGMKTSFKDLFAVGWRPIGLMLAETLWIGVLVFASVKFVI